MNNDYLDYLAHYRTPGTPNGVSHTPGYDAVGKPAMSEAERRARRKLRRSSTYKAIKRAANTLKREGNKFKKLGSGIKKDFESVGGSSKRKLSRAARRFDRRTDKSLAVPVKLTRKTIKKTSKGTRMVARKASKIAKRTLRAFKLPIII